LLIFKKYVTIHDLETGGFLLGRNKKPEIKRCVV
jgi:hypothetical protein